MRPSDRTADREADEIIKRINMVEKVIFTKLNFNTFMTTASDIIGVLLDIFAKDANNSRITQGSNELIMLATLAVDIFPLYTVSTLALGCLFATLEIMGLPSISLCIITFIQRNSLEFDLL